MSVTSQLVLAWNGTTLQVEASKNGQRVKLTTVSFADLPGEIQFELQTQLRENQAKAERTTWAPEASKVDPERERMLRNQAAAEARLKAYAEWYAGLSREQQAAEDLKREQRKEKQDAQRREQGMRVYQRVATDHSIELANKVVDDPTRRPTRVEVSTNGTTKVYYYPRTNKTKRERKWTPKAQGSVLTLKQIKSLKF